MRVKVIMPFKDKYKKVVYQKGQEIEVTKERFGELTSAAPFVEAKPQPPKPPPTRVQIDGGKPATKKATKKKSTPKKPTPKKSTKKKTAKK